MQVASLLTLPNEVLFEIGRLLDIASLAYCCMSCQRLNQVMCADDLYAHHYGDKWPFDVPVTHVTKHMCMRRYFGEKPVPAYDSGNVAELRGYIMDLLYEEATRRRPRISLIDKLALVSEFCHPEATWRQCMRRVAPLERLCRTRVVQARADGSRHPAAALLEAMQVQGFAGVSSANYYQLHSSLLWHVMTERRGLPIALCILFAHLCSCCDIEVKLMGLPGHFMCAVDNFYVDCFNMRIMTEDEVISEWRDERYLFVADPHAYELSDHEVLRRVVRNLCVLAETPLSGKMLAIMFLSQLLQMSDDEDDAEVFGALLVFVRRVKPHVVSEDAWAEILPWLAARGFRIP